MSTLYSVDVSEVHGQGYGITLTLRAPLRRTPTG